MINDYGKYFKEEEFVCKCGHCPFPGVSQELIEKLNAARAFAGVPFGITSGYRCRDYNRAIKGSKTSSHMDGLAADIACKDTHKRFMILSALLTYFDRVGVAEDFIHVDVDYSKKGEILWVY